MMYRPWCVLRKFLSGFAVALSLLNMPQAQAAETARLIVGIDGAETLIPARSPAEFVARLQAGVTWPLELVRTVGDRAVVVNIPGIQDDRQLDDVSRQLSAVPGVRYVIPDRQVRPDYVPTDPRFSSQWYLQSEAEGEPAGIAAIRAWDEERGVAGIVIAVLDSGIIPHEDINQGRVLPGYDFVDNADGASGDGDGWDDDATDPGDAVLAGSCPDGGPSTDQPSSWHGLHMAGIMIATADNAVGVSGINHASRLLPVRVLGKCGGRLSDTVEAMRWAAGLSVSGVPSNPNPADVLNLSFGGEGDCSPLEQDAIDEIVATGAVIVTSAGNDASSLTGPALCDDVIVVAAVDRNGSRAATYTNVGSRVKVSAPGGEGFDGILSTYNAGDVAAGDDAYALLQGTSVAAAQVSAIVSLMLSANHDLSPAQVGQLIAETARPCPHHDLQYVVVRRRPGRRGRCCDRGRRRTAGPATAAGYRWWWRRWRWLHRVPRSRRRHGHGSASAAGGCGGGCPARTADGCRGRGLNGFQSRGFPVTPVSSSSGVASRIAWISISKTSVCPASG